MGPQPLAFRSFTAALLRISRTHGLAHAEDILDATNLVSNLTTTQIYFIRTILRNANRETEENKKRDKPEGES